jgi:hypothetical protein
MLSFIGSPQWASAAYAMKKRPTFLTSARPCSEILYEESLRKNIPGCSMLQARIAEGIRLGRSMSKRRYLALFWITQVRVQSMLKVVYVELEFSMLLHPVV